MGIEQIPIIDKRREELDKEHAELDSREYTTPDDEEKKAEIEEEHQRLSDQVREIEEESENSQLAPEQQPQPEKTQEPQPTQQTEKPPEKTPEELLETDIDAAKRILDDKSLDFQEQVELLKDIEQHLSKVLNVSPDEINLRQLTKMTPEELSKWLNEGSPEKQLEGIIEEIGEGKIIPKTFLKFISTPGASKSISKILNSPEFQEGIKKPENQDKLKAVIEKFQKFISKEKEIPKPEAVGKAKEFIEGEEKKKQSFWEQVGGWKTVGGVAGSSLIMFLILIFLGEFKLLEKASNIGDGGNGGKGGKK